MASSELSKIALRKLTMPAIQAQRKKTLRARLPIDGRLATRGSADGQRKSVM